jgi:NADPH:quinone reductase-like Zn-dependent oxidoreductase
MTMGIVDGPKDKLGLEASGVITRVGSAINHVKVGDRVIAMDIGCFATRKMVLGQLVVRIPEDLTFEDAATMPAVYTTVIHSVINLGQLAKGQVREISTGLSLIRNRS